MPYLHSRYSQTSVVMSLILAWSLSNSARSADADEADDVPFRSETMTVYGDKITRETVLRVIGSGLIEPRSDDPDKADRVICRIESMTGSRACKHLWCSTNGELKRIRDGTLDRFNTVGEALSRGGAVDVTFSNVDPAIPCTNRAKLLRQISELPPSDRAYVHISDESLRQFSDAYTEVRAIQAIYDPRIERTTITAKVNRLQREADDKMIAVIEAAGLDLDAYNRIAVRVQKDQHLQSKVRELVAN